MHARCHARVPEKRRFPAGSAWCDARIAQTQFNEGAKLHPLVSRQAHRPCRRVREKIAAVEFMH
jgi:hypothetical protein